MYKKIIYALTKSQSISNEDLNLYEYALKILVHSLVNILITISIGMIFGMLRECFCMLFVFFILRKFTGGLHAEKYVNCLIASTLIMICNLLLIKLFICNQINILFISILLFSVFLIIFLPICESKNKPLSKNELIIFKFISISITIICFFITIILLIKNNSIGFAIGIGMFSNSILLLISTFNKLKKGNVNDKRHINES